MICNNQLSTQNNLATLADTLAKDGKVRTDQLALIQEKQNLLIGTEVRGVKDLISHLENKTESFNIAL